MARPRTFSIDDAVARATEVFRLRGYTEAGLHDLLRAMGIVRGSFYKAFGSKQALFLRCLERYDREVVDGAVALLRDERLDGHERIARLFRAGLDAAGEAGGCLLCNTAGGPVLEDEPVREAVRRQLDRLTSAFAAAVETTGAPDPQGEAHRLTMLYVGLRVLARGGASPAALERAVAPLTHPNSTRSD